MISDIMEKGVFRAKSVSGLRSMTDGETYTTRDGSNIIRYSYRTGKVIDTILHSKQLAKFGIKSFSDYSFSYDEKQILLLTSFEPIYRRSFKANYYIYNRDTKTASLASDNGKQSYATFSPDGTKIAFVRNNNLFYKDLIANKEFQITTDGEWNHIINGSTDWVYEEEFGFAKAFEWASDSKSIAYYRFDESRVKVFNMNKFEGNLYPENYAFKYPKAGEQNSIVSIYTYDLQDHKSTKMDVGNEDNQYIARIKWTTNPDKLAIVRLNRLQNKLDILVANTKTGQTTTLYSESNPRYISEVTDSYLNFLPNGNQLIINSEKDGYNHLYLYNMDGTLANQITKGSWDVREFLGVDTQKNTVYYTASAVSPMQRELYSTTLNGKSTKKLSLQEGTNSATFSNGMKYYINTYSSTTTPSYITLHSANGKLLRVLESNEKLNETLKKYEVAQKEFFSFVTPEGVSLNGWMIKPANFDENKKYPVLMTQYSGPGSQEVVDSWEIGWEHVLAQNGYLVVSVDGRGTGGRGETFKKQTYGQLGKLEVEDQISAAKYIGSLPFADKDRIAIWGWSYGGFMSLNAILKGADVFKVAIAIAPVTNWRFYDSIYTERFNGLPQDNPAGYDDNSPINHVDKLKGKLLIIHGTSDDNVHIQNSYELVSKLIEKNKQFDMMVYPDKNHSIYGGKTRLQLYTKLIDYLNSNL